MRAAALLSALALWALPSGAAALCDVSYKAQPGDTLATIAARHYGEGADWAPLFYANLALLPPDDGDAPVAAGSDIYVPCAPGTEAAQPDPRAPGAAEVTVGVMGGFAPFSDRTWPGGGLSVALLSAALDEAPQRLSHRTDWTEAAEGGGDIRFPVIAPNCIADAPCGGYHLSQPIIQLPIMLFARVGGDFAFRTDDDVIGRTLCRPEGEGVEDLDRANRRWVSEGRVTLVRAPSAEACLELVMQGGADAASFDLYRGAAKIAAMGLQGRIAPLEPPLSREALYAGVPRSHWRATALVYRLNAGLDRLRASGRLDAIVAHHMSALGALMR